MPNGAAQTPAAAVLCDACQDLKLGSLFNATWSAKQERDGRHVRDVGCRFVSLAPGPCVLCRVLSRGMENMSTRRCKRSCNYSIRAAHLDSWSFKEIEGYDIEIYFDWRSIRGVMIYLDNYNKRNLFDIMVDKRRGYDRFPKHIDPASYISSALARQQEFLLNKMIPPTITDYTGWCEVRSYPIAFLLQNEGTSPPFHSEPPQDFNPAFPRELISICQREHHCGSSSKGALSNLLLLDCDTRCVERGISNKPYVALSYVWGTNAAESTVPVGSHIPIEVPRLILDAIEVTKALGYRYIWIDKYCIDHLDAAHVQSQINQMDRVYSCADVTIVAAAGGDSHYGLPGVRGKARVIPTFAQFDDFRLVTVNGGGFWQDIRSSKWASRGWTYQEGLLSTRRLVFTDQQVLFECNQMQCTEWQKPRTGLRSTDHEDFDRRRVFRAPPRPGTSSSELLVAVRAAITEYSTRKLTRDEDTFDAFSGVFNAFRALSSGDLSNVAGVPYLGTGLPTLAALASDATMVNFVAHLCWYFDHKKNPKRSRRWQFPSWSWTGWTGQVSWPTCLPIVGDVLLLAEVRNIRDNGKILELSAMTLDEWTCATGNEAAAETITADARLLDQSGLHLNIPSGHYEPAVQGAVAGRDFMVIPVVVCDSGTHFMVVGPVMSSKHLRRIGYWSIPRHSEGNNFSFEWWRRKIGEKAGSKRQILLQ